MERTTSRKAQSDTTTIEIVELSPQELSLLRVLRNGLRFGEVTIRVRNGAPYQVVRVTEMVNLD